MYYRVLSGWSLTLMVGSLAFFIAALCLGPPEGGPLTLAGILMGSTGSLGLSAGLAIHELQRRVRELERRLPPPA